MGGVGAGVAGVLRAACVAAALLASATGCAQREAPPRPPPPAEPPADPDAELERLTRSIVIASRPRLRACYEGALQESPTMEGRVVLVVDVGQDGRAARVLEAHRDGLDDGVVRCLARVLRTIAFHDGAARAIRIQVPLAFSKRDAPPAIP